MNCVTITAKTMKDVFNILEQIDEQIYEQKINNSNIVVELSVEDAEYLRFNVEEIDRMYNENEVLRNINGKLYDIFNENESFSSSEIVPTIVSDRIKSNYTWLYGRFISVVSLLFNNGHDEAGKFMFQELSKKYSIW